MIKNTFLLVLLTVLCFVTISCKKEIQLTKAGYTIDSVMVDYTPVYFFLEKENNDTIINVNRKNTISTTNWVFHIDKRLPLKAAVTEIIRLQEKRDNAVFHKNDEAGNFYSYTDTTAKKLAFMPSKNIKYSFESSTEYVNNRELYFDKNGNFLTEGKLSKDGLKDFLKELSDSTSISLCFNEKLTFGEYLATWIEVISLKNADTKISEVHYIKSKK